MKFLWLDSLLFMRLSARAAPVEGCSVWELQVTTLQATRSKRAEVDPNGALAHKRKAGTLADIAEVCFLPATAKK